MSKDQREMPGEKQESEYFKIADDKREFKGNFVGEIINQRDKPVLHLRVPDGVVMTKPGRGDVVIPGISRQGWAEVIKTLGNLGQNASISDAKRALAKAPFITSDKPSTGH